MALQILVRNRKDPHLPRCGQPRLTVCICFRGTGKQIAEEERRQYHPDVHVLFQPKAWFDAATCNKWVMEVAAQEMPRDLPEEENFLPLDEIQELIELTYDSE